MLREIPDDFADDLDLTALNKATSYSISNCQYMFAYCYSLRSIPDNLIKQLYTSCATATYTLYYFGFNSCYVLDKLNSLPIQNVTMTSNMFLRTFEYCQRLKSLTFNMQEDGTPYTAEWKNQAIDLTVYVGYVDSASSVTRYNSGITSEKKVTNDETYQALKDDPDWFTGLPKYSRYNHDSAVETINSLPDTSAYLEANGGTNKITFKGESGSATDGGAINTLTDEEIAVATAKGWTVVLA
jgi:hypothetical protein